MRNESRLGFPPEVQFYWLHDERYKNRPATLEYDGDPYERVVLPDGRRHWRLSPALHWRQKELLEHFTCTDRELIDAFQVISRVDQSLPLEWDPSAQITLTEADAAAALNDFMIPFVRRLCEPRTDETGSGERRALEWLQGVLNLRNRTIAKAISKEHQASYIITAGEILCWELDALPTKADIRDWLVSQPGDAFGYVEGPDEFDFKKDTWRLRFQAAGLTGLLQGRGY
jgi:hypothetical protein